MRRTSEIKYVHEKKRISEDIIGEKLIEVEEIATGTVNFDKINYRKFQFIANCKINFFFSQIKWKVFTYYIKFAGLFITIVAMILYFTFQAFSISANMWLSKWCSDPDIVVNGTANYAKTDSYLSIYTLFGICQGKKNKHFFKLHLIFFFMPHSFFNSFNIFIFVHFLINRQNYV